MPFGARRSDRGTLPRPMARRSRCSALALSLLASLLTLSACGGSRDKYGRKTTPPPKAQKLDADTVAAGAERATTSRRFRVRVYADDQYRAQTLRWEARFEGRLDRFNRLVEPIFGARLELVDAQPWPRTGDNSDLRVVADALRELDPGTDVDWVIGLTTGLPQMTQNHSLLGVASPLDKFIVLRGLSQTDEITQRERDHKSMALLLHEWGHTLGAIHTREDVWIMHTRYSYQQSSLSALNTAIMKTALKYWGGPPSFQKRAAMFEELAELTKTLGQWDGWEHGAFEEFAQLVSEGPSKLAIDDVSEMLTTKDRAAYYRAAEMAQAGQYKQAWRLLEALTERYESESAVMLLGCRVSAQERGDKYPTRKVCEAAVKLAPESPDPPQVLAEMFVRQNDFDKALPLLLEAQAKLERADKVDEARWERLAFQYQKIGAVTPLESLLRRLPDGDNKTGFATYVQTTRRRYGLPPDSARFGVPVAREAAYTKLVSSVLSTTYSGQFKDAERAALDGLRIYKNAPGLLIALCDTYARQRKYAQARKACARGLKGYPDATWGHYLSAVLAQQQRNRRAAIRHFERTVDLDPTLESAYLALAAEYAAAGNKASRARLAVRFREQFGRDLPAP